MYQIPEKIVCAMLYARQYVSDPHYRWLIFVNVSKLSRCMSTSGRHTSNYRFFGIRNFSADAKIRIVEFSAVRSYPGHEQLSYYLTYISKLLVFE